MEWIGISGSWRHSTPRLEQDVIKQVTKIIANGDGIVTGGALGVDYLATETVLKLDKTLKRLKIIIPTDLNNYTQHFKMRAKEGVITNKQASLLIDQLKSVYKIRPNAIIEVQNAVAVDQKAYYVRNTAVVRACKRLVAFQVNNSQGTQNAIETARNMGKKVKIYCYETTK